MREEVFFKYAVNIFYEGVKSDGTDSLWEESIVLIYAIDEAEALKKATKFAKDNEHDYIASNGVNIKWQFRIVDRAVFIEGELENGTELFSRFLKKDIGILLEGFN